MLRKKITGAKIEDKDGNVLWNASADPVKHANQ